MLHGIAFWMHYVVKVLRQDKTELLRKVSFGWAEKDKMLIKSSKSLWKQKKEEIRRKKWENDKGEWILKVKIGPSYIRPYVYID